jgi:dephospho-CoA kinase
MAKIIGLTGGIGSGKTTIAHYFASQKIPVFIADDEAKKIMNSVEIKHEIKTVFGDTVFENGILNRKQLANLVFNKPESLKKLNEIIHPAVKTAFKNWCDSHQKEKFVIYESALIFETKSENQFDFIITVTAPLETRIERVMQRDKTSKENVLARIQNQFTDEERLAKSDFVINTINQNTLENDLAEILKIFNNF